MENPRQDAEPVDHPALFVQALNDLISRFEAAEASEQSTFQARRETLQDELQKLQNQLLCLEQEHAAAKKSREQARDAEFQRLINNKAKDFAKGSETVHPSDQQDPPFAELNNSQDGAENGQVREPPPRASIPQQETGNNDTTSRQVSQPSPIAEAQTAVPMKEISTPRKRRQRSTDNLGTWDEIENEVALGRGQRKRTKTEKAATDATFRKPEDSTKHDTPSENTRQKHKAMKTICFADLYQSGKAKYKHMIVRFPKDDGNWFILRCDDHLHFGAGPFKGALKHLGGKQHNVLDADYAKAIELLGVQVLNCNEQRAERNNTAFLKALKSGYKPFNVVGKGTEEGRHETIARRRHTSHAEEPDDIDERGLTEMDTAHEPESSLEQTSDIVEGKIYLARWMSSETWYVALILPLENFDIVGMSGAFKDAGLDSYIPRCYASQGKTITGWADGYEDGGKHFQKRKYPVMYFDDDLNIPLDGKWELPQEKLYEWVSPKLLREFSFSDVDCQVAPGYRAAQRYQERMERFKGRKESDVWEFDEEDDEVIDNPPPPPTIISISSSSPSRDDGGERQSDHNDNENDEDPNIGEASTNFDDYIEAIYAGDGQAQPTSSEDMRPIVEPLPRKDDEDMDVRSHISNSDCESYSTSRLLDFVDDVLRPSSGTGEGLADAEATVVADINHTNTEPPAVINEDIDVLDMDLEVNAPIQPHNSPSVSQTVENQIVSDFSRHHQSLAQAALAAVNLHTEMVDASTEANIDAEWQDQQPEAFQGLSSNADQTNAMEEPRDLPCGQTMQLTTDDSVHTIRSTEDISMRDATEGILSSNSTTRNSCTTDTGLGPSHLSASAVPQTTVSVGQTETTGSLLATEPTIEPNETRTAANDVHRATPRPSTIDSPERAPITHNQQATPESERLSTSTQRRNSSIQRDRPTSGSKYTMLGLQYLLDTPSSSQAPPAPPAHMSADDHRTPEVIDLDVSETINTAATQPYPGPTMPSSGPSVQHQPPLLTATATEPFFENPIEIAYMQTKQYNAQHSTFYIVGPSGENHGAQIPPTVEVSAGSVLTTASNFPANPSSSASWEAVESLAPLSVPVKQYVENLKTANNSANNYFHESFQNNQQAFDHHHPRIEMQRESTVVGRGQAATGSSTTEGGRNSSLEQYATPRASTSQQPLATGPEYVRAKISCIRCQYMRRDCDSMGPPCGTCIQHGGDPCPGYPSRPDEGEIREMHQERPTSLPYRAHTRPFLPPIMFREARRDNYV